MQKENHTVALAQSDLLLREHALPLELADDVATRGVEVVEPVRGSLLAVAGRDGANDARVCVDDGVMTPADPDAQRDREEAGEGAELCP
jgi:hypothetical protein